MKLASVFLSYPSKELPFVRNLAEELGRRGVVAWVDAFGVQAGDELRSRFRKAIEDQEGLVVVLSEDSSESRWIEEELQNARRKAGGQDYDRILAITFGEPLAVIRKHRYLAEHWIEPDGRPKKACIVVDPESIDVADIAVRIAKAVYGWIGLNLGHEMGIGLDQRGSGRMRAGIPDRGDIPPSIYDVNDLPVLLFRPDSGRRKEDEVLSDDEWQRLGRDTLAALEEAMGKRGGNLRDIYVFGDAQLGWPFLLGYNILNRSNKRYVFCPNENDVFRFDFNGGKLPEGDPERLEWRIPPESNANELTMFLGDTNYLDTAEEYVRAAHPKTPFAFLRASDAIDNPELLQLIANLRTAVVLCQRQHKTRLVRLLCALPFGAMPLLAGHLDNLLDGNFKFLEYRKDRRGRHFNPSEYYVELPMNRFGLGAEPQC